MEKLLRGQTNTDQLEKRFIASGGRCIGAQINMALVRDQHGSPRYFITQIQDITERKKAQEHALQLARLEKEMVRLDRLNLVGEMAASISHEVRNPMTTVRGFLQMLRSKEKLVRYQSYFDLMVDELDRANNIITEFLSIGKNKASERRWQNLNAIVEALYLLIQADALERDKYVKIELMTVKDLLLDD